MLVLASGVDSLRISVHMMIDSSGFISSWFSHFSPKGVQTHTQMLKLEIFPTNFKSVQRNLMLIPLVLLQIEPQQTYIPTDTDGKHVTCLLKLIFKI